MSVLFVPVGQEFSFFLCLPYRVSDGDINAISIAYTYARSQTVYKCLPCLFPLPRSEGNVPSHTKVILKERLRLPSVVSKTTRVASDTL